MGGPQLLTGDEMLLDLQFRYCLWGSCGAGVTLRAAFWQTGDLVVTACSPPPPTGGTEHLSSCTVPASMTRVLTCGEAPGGWVWGNLGFFSWGC